MDCSKANLKKGMKGDSRITELENYLSKKIGVKNKQYYFGIKDTYFGPLLDTAVRNWQRDNRLVVDGYFGPISCNKAELNTTVKTPATPTTFNQNIGAARKTQNELKAYVFAQGDSYSCGPTSLCMCFSVFDMITPANFQASKNRIINLAGTSQTVGTHPDNLDSSANKFNSNFKMTSENYTNMNTIAKHINANEPIICHINTTPALDYQGKYGHYIVVLGYNYTNNTVKIIDPSRTKLGARWIHLNILKQAIDSRLTDGHVKSIHYLKRS